MCANYIYNHVICSVYKIMLIWRCPARPSRLIPRLFCVTDKANLAMSHHPIPLVPRRLLARCGGHARESGVVRSLIKLNNIISLVRERSLLRSLVHYFSWGKRACSHGHYSVFRVSPYSATPLQGCMPPHTENHWPMNRILSSHTFTSTQVSTDWRPRPHNTHMSFAALHTA